MSVYLFSVVLVLVALAALFGAYKALLKSGWFIKWLQGSAGFLSLVLTIFSALMVFDLLGYYRAQEGQALATLIFSKVGDQEFDAELVKSDNSKQLYRINGDQWQLDVRLVNAPFLSFDGLPSYKLDRLSGRYLSLEQERTEIRTLHELSGSGAIDFWKYLSEMRVAGLLNAQYGSASFMPMVDGAIYQVVLHENGIKAEPVNEIAKHSLGDWK